MHSDLLDNIWRNEGEICDDGIDNDGNGYIDDCYGFVRTGLTYILPSNEYLIHY